MSSSERIIAKNPKKEISEGSLNISLTSNNSFYENLNLETKKDIIFLIKSGYDKRIIIKLYIFLKPSNLNEAIHFLSKENDIYQHIFINSSNKNNFCEVCGEKKLFHNKNDKTKTINISYNSILTNKIDEKIDILRIKNIKEKKIEYEYNKCKICDENISQDENIENKCEKCDNYFCNDCLYLHLKELIRNGNYAIFCPGCKFVYNKEKIEKILSFNNQNKNEINNLKKLLEKSNTKQMVLKNPELIFCPIANCEGYAKKNNNYYFNICNKGHKFCTKCGDLWHKDGKCKEEEMVDKLFQEYYKKYNLKKCPYCNIITKKMSGCNHIKCQYCNKDWCWLCEKIFVSTEEHYGNINSKCYNKMMHNINNEELKICSKCNIETLGRFHDYRCDHSICDNCFIDYLLKSDTMILFPQKILNCIIYGCSGIRLVDGFSLMRFIKRSNNQKLIKKYKLTFLFLEYIIIPFFPQEFGNFCENLAKLLDKIFCCFNKIEKYKVLTIILAILLGIILFPFFHLICSTFLIYAIKKIYYKKFLPDIKVNINNQLYKLLLFIIIFSEEIICLINY